MYEKKNPLLGGVWGGFFKDRRPLIRKISDSWRWMPFAVLLMVALTSALAQSPTYCDWMCPFKAVTEFEQVTGVESAVKAGIFISLFGGLVVVLPILTKKRTQCSYLCPLGAINTLSNKVSPFTVKIDRQLCNYCYKCVQACPLFALTNDAVKKGTVSIFCTKCGKCIDACTKQAIHYGIAGVPAGRMAKFSRNMFLFVSFLFMAIFASGSIITVVKSFFNLFI